MGGDGHGGDAGGGGDEPTGSGSRPAASGVASPESLAGSVIDRYRVLAVLGEGGFGVVYLAEQTEPVRRRVALKVIKPGMDTRAVLARFEAERQALAVMDHPCVARVYDGGVAASGRPYFVMEYVRGLPITEHCDRHRLGLEDRLGLFVRVCSAVQHAHMKGVIHRDLKPSNILVEYGDGIGGGAAAGATPKVIDFGVAKALNQRLTERTIFTERGQLIGTPEYMSPEQAEMSGQDIDTRADVYSLGVILYELLTGVLPFDASALRGAGFAEIQRIIREVDPPRPSTRLSGAGTRATGPAPGDAAAGVGGGVEGVARLRGLDTRSLLRALRGDLDWVVMKCLEKDRSRRYETPGALAEELQRYLRSEPVSAGPPSASYRVRKFVRRHRGPVAAGAGVALALVVGMAGVTLALAEVDRQRQIAIEREREAVEAKRSEAEQRRVAESQMLRAVEAEREARLRADELEQVAAFQASQLSGIDTARMGERLRGVILERHRAALEKSDADAAGVERALAEFEASLAGLNFTSIALVLLEEHVFERALAAIDERFSDQPLLRARLLQTAATTMAKLGLLEAALRPQREAMELRRGVLGDEHAETMASMGMMGNLLRTAGDHPGAGALYAEVLALRRRVLGEDHEDTLISLANMGGLLYEQGRLDEAEGYHREAVEGYRRVLGDDHPSTLAAAGNLAVLLHTMGRLAEAEPLYLEALEGQRRVLGDEHPYTLSSMAGVGVLLQAQGKFAEAEPHYRGVLEARRRLEGDEHPATLTALNNLGWLLLRQGRYGEAEGCYREALEGRRRVLGPDHPMTLVSLTNMGLLLREVGRLEEAERACGEAVGRARAALPAGHWHTGVFLVEHGRTLAAMLRFAEAEASLLEACGIFESALGQDHERTIGVAEDIAGLYERWHEAEPGAGRDAEAARWRARSGAGSGGAGAGGG